MSKTIEELARQYAKYQTDERGYGSMKEWKQDVAIYYDDAKEVLSWLFTQPLAQRMTAEEKEMVRVIYNEELGMAQHLHLKAKASNDISCRQHYYGLREPYISRIKLLERIFGADFFKEGE